MITEDIDSTRNFNYYFLVEIFIFIYFIHILHKLVLLLLLLLLYSVYPFSLTCVYFIREIIFSFFCLSCVLIDELESERTTTTTMEVTKGKKKKKLVPPKRCKPNESTAERAQE